MQQPNAGSTMVPLYKLLLVPAFRSYRLVPKMVLTLCNLRWWCFSFHQLAKILHLQSWSSSPAATCAGGVFPWSTSAFTNVHAYCNLHCVVVVVVLVYYINSTSSSCIFIHHRPQPPCTYTIIHSYSTTATHRWPSPPYVQPLPQHTTTTTHNHCHNIKPQLPQPHPVHLGRELPSSYRKWSQGHSNIRGSPA